VASPLSLFSWLAVLVPVVLYGCLDKGGSYPPPVSTRVTFPDETLVSAFPAGLSIFVVAEDDITYAVGIVAGGRASGGLGDGGIGNGGLGAQWMAAGKLDRATALAGVGMLPVSGDGQTLAGTSVVTRELQGTAQAGLFSYSVKRGRITGRVSGAGPGFDATFDAEFGVSCTVPRAMLGPDAGSNSGGDDAFVYVDDSHFQTAGCAPFKSLAMGQN